jgi:hypothetical protein
MMMEKKKKISPYPPVLIFHFKKWRSQLPATIQPPFNTEASGILQETFYFFGAILTKLWCFEVVSFMPNQDDTQIQKKKSSISEFHPNSMFPRIKIITEVGYRHG